MTVREFIGAYSLDVICLNIYTEDYTPLLDGFINLMAEEDDWKFDKLDKELGDKLIKEWFVNQNVIFIKIYGGKN